MVRAVHLKKEGVHGITTSVGGVYKKLETIHSSVSGTLKELQTIHSSVGGTLKLIHSGEKCLDINLASLASSTTAGTYDGVTAPNNRTPSASLYVPGIHTLIRAETDLSALSSDFDDLKGYFQVQNTNGRYVKDSISSNNQAVTFAQYNGGGGSGSYGGGTILDLYAMIDGNYLRFYLLKYTYSYSPSGQNCVVSTITTSLKSKLYYK